MNQLARVQPFSSRGAVVRPRRPFCLQARCECGLLVIEYEPWGLVVFASTVAELADELSEQLSMLWIEYAAADESCLTASAKALKRRLLEDFELVEQ
jgi:hypothetical protein